MTEQDGRSAVQNPRAAQKSAEFSVVVGCHGFVCAISTRHVTRLTLNDEVTATTGVRGMVLAGNEALASFNLGALLGMPPLESAWVLLHVPHQGGVVPVALRTGTCLLVRSVAVEAELPDGLFEARGNAVLGAFVAGARLGLDSSVPYGLILDMDRFWSDKELQAARSVLARAKQEGPRG